MLPLETPLCRPSATYSPGDSRAIEGMVVGRDARDAYGTGFGPAALENRRTEGASVRLSGLNPGTYVVSLHETLDDGNVVAEFTAPAANDRLDIALPPFTGDVALKVSGGTERTWGIVPRSARAWTTTDAEPKSDRLCSVSRAKRVANAGSRWDPHAGARRESDIGSHGAGAARRSRSLGGGGNRRAIRSRPCDRQSGNNPGGSRPQAV